MLIRRADVRDVPQFGKIINDCAEYGLMLHRSLEFLYEHVRDFYVAVDDAAPVGDSRGVVGVCGLGVVWSNLAEVYSLAVAPPWRGKGVGRQLVEAVIRDAEALCVSRLMSLTYERAFFEKLGFCVVDRLTLPMKVWSECARCPKNQACDEIAMIRVLNVPEATSPRPSESETGSFRPVVLGLPGRNASPPTSDVRA
ncbi:MAG: N-acetyltransferase [Phycisphaeraceae bacterium]|nr:N-acetyltransferase [Phycisphaeraceae bacterium]